MKPLKNNFFVKTARSYVIFFYVCFPLIIIAKLFILITTPRMNSQQTSLALPNVDLGGFFGNEKFMTDLNYGSIVLWLFIIVVNVVIIAGIFYGIIKLNKFLKNVYNDRPFTKDNGKHLKVIGILVMILSTLIYLANNTTNFLNPLPVSDSINYLNIIGLLISTLLNPSLAIGLVVFVIGEVIIRAAELKEEQDLTV
ncbi:MAG: DUF2975 domain-containing protein [Ignavibacteriaceae bacterium]